MFKHASNSCQDDSISVSHLPLCALVLNRFQDWTLWVLGPVNARSKSCRSVVRRKHPILPAPFGGASLNEILRLLCPHLYMLDSATCRVRVLQGIDNSLEQSRQAK
jgi:hypothetical protein